jgi:alkyldihydroxyacetonephosphate synthase
LAELIVGSEGIFGVITEVTLRVHRKPDERRYEGWMFESFAEGIEALRQLEQSGVQVEVARLSDDVETQMSASMSNGQAHEAKGSIAIVGTEGTTEDVSARAAAAGALLTRAGGRALGEGPGTSWESGRFEGPYLRDTLLDHKVMLETLETATTWSNLPNLYDSVRKAIADTLQQRGTPGLVACHVSHLYPDGASLYFTFAARQEAGRELQQWQAVKSAASDAIVKGSGTITHHHAIGRDHAPWMLHEIGPGGVESLRAVKTRLDPAGIMNPGKLLPMAGPAPTA